MKACINKNLLAFAIFPLMTNVMAYDYYYDPATDQALGDGIVTLFDFVSKKITEATARPEPEVVPVQLLPKEVPSCNDPAFLTKQNPCIEEPTKLELTQQSSPAATTNLQDAITIETIGKIKIANMVTQIKVAADCITGKITHDAASKKGQSEWVWIKPKTGQDKKTFKAMCE